MSDEIRLTIQVIVSLAIIFGVLWWMWRLPGEPGAASHWSSVLSFCSAWLGLAAVGVGVWLWWTVRPERWAVAAVLVWAAALATGLLALWTWRRTPAERLPEEVLLQRLQARVGVGLGLLAVALWYAFMITHLAALRAMPEGG